MKNKSVSSVVVSLFLFAALAVTGIAVKQTMDTRRKASEREAGVYEYFEPSTVSFSKGETKEVSLYLDTTDTAQKVSFFETQICYDTGVEISNSSTDVILPDNGYFTEVLKNKVVMSSDGKKACLTLSLSCGSKPTADLKSGIIEVAKVKFKALGESGDNFAVVTKDTRYTYFNTQNAADGNVPVTVSSDLKLTVVPPKEETEATLSIGPGSINFDKGQTRDVFIKVNTKRAADAVQVALCYGKELKINDLTKDVQITDTTSKGLSAVVSPVNTIIVGDKTCANLLSIAKASADVELPVGDFNIFKVTFTGVEKGNGIVSIDVANSEVSGPSQNGGPNMMVLSGDQNTINYNIGDPSVTPTAGPVRDNAGVSVTLDKASYKVGDVATATVSVDTGVNSRFMDAGNFGLCVSKYMTIGEYTDKEIGNSISSANTLVKTIMVPGQSVEKKADGTNCFQFMIQTDQTSLLSGRADIAKIKFSVINSGNGGIEWNPDVTEISGPKGTQYNDNVILISTYNPVTFSVDADIAEYLYFKFKMTFEGLTDIDGACGKLWNKVGVKVMDKDQNMSEDLNAIVKSIGETVVVGGKKLVVFEGTAKLANYNPNGAVFALINGPRHIYDKYGKDGQSAEYKIFAGELVGMNKDEASAKVFDFTKYPLKTGDVNNDNILNGSDYVKIKTAILAGGVDKEVDLDGDCRVVGADTVYFINNLADKNGKTY